MNTATNAEQGKAFLEQFASAAQQELTKLKTINFSGGMPQENLRQWHGLDTREIRLCPPNLL